MAIVTGSVLRAAAKFTLDNLPDIFYNIWHMRCTNSNSQSQPNLIDDLLEVLEEIYGAVDTYLSDLLNFDAVNLYDVTADLPLNDYNWPTLTAGAEMGEILPHAAAMGLYGKTIYPNRIAKKYIPGMTEAHTEDGVFNSSALAGFANMAAAILQPAVPSNGSTWQFGIWGFTVPETETEPHILIPTVSWSVSAYPYYQRKRGPGRGT